MKNLVCKRISKNVTLGMFKIHFRKQTDWLLSVIFMRQNLVKYIRIKKLLVLKIRYSI